MPFAKTLNPSDLNDNCYKFVKVAGQFRFTTIYVDHNMLVDEHELSLVQAAGSFTLDDDDKMIKASNYSMTLKRSCSQQDFEDVAALLGRKLLPKGLLE